MTTFNLWEIKVDPATGRPLSEARRFTQWPGFSFANAGNMSITADGKLLALLRMNAQADVYVAELEPGGKAMKNPRRLTLEESDDMVWDWTAGSRAVLFQSNRNGNLYLFKQDISKPEAEAIFTSAEAESHPSLSPDRAFILYLVSEQPGPTATQCGFLCALRVLAVNTGRLSHREDAKDAKKTLCDGRGARNLKKLDTIVTSAIESRLIKYI